MSTASPISTVHEKAHDRAVEEHHEVQALRMGNLTEDQVQGAKALSASKKTNTATTKSDKHQQSYYDLLLQSIYQDIANYNQDIEQLENAFEAEFGDAWREEIALRVFDPDDFPFREEGENMHDYRERMEQALIDEMLNPDGTIKDKYKNDPEMAKYAEWAQTVYNRDKAVEMANDIKNNPNGPEAQAAMEKLEQKRSSELNLSVADQLQGHTMQGTVLQTDQKHYEQSSLQDKSEFTQAFLAPSI